MRKSLDHLHFRRSEMIRGWWEKKRKEEEEEEEEERKAKAGEREENGVQTANGGDGTD